MCGSVSWQQCSRVRARGSEAGRGSRVSERGGGAPSRPRSFSTTTTQSYHVWTSRRTLTLLRSPPRTTRPVPRHLVLDPPLLISFPSSHPHNSFSITPVISPTGFVSSLGMWATVGDRAAGSSRWDDGGRSHAEPASTAVQRDQLRERQEGTAERALRAPSSIWQAQRRSWGDPHHRGFPPEQPR